MGANGSVSAGGGERLAAAQTGFGFRLFRELVKADARQNVIVSPVCLAFALMMVWNGAGGKTREAVATTLGLEGLEPDEANRSAAALRKTLEEAGPQVQLALANALWANQGVLFPREFLQRAELYYAATARTLNFADAAAAEEVNHWVHEKTGGKIDTLVSGGDLAPPADCVLTSALYFKGLWAAPFDPGATSDGEFTLPGGRRKRVPMMSQLGRFDYLETPQLQLIGLPYGDGRHSMLLCLPAPKRSLPAFLEHLDAGEWQGWISQLEKTQVQLTLPRASLTYEADVRKALTALGMGPAFGSGADFTPMGLGGRAIARVKHKTRTEINEEGTEAAAATAVVMTRSFMPAVAMVIDRPFFCAICERSTGAVLFMGAVVEPG